MKCTFCGKEFVPKKNNPNQKFCSDKCQQRHWKGRYHLLGKTAQPTTLDQWVRESRQVNLDYGTYRGLIEQGKTFDEIKAQNHVQQIHAHRTTHHSFSTGDLI